MMTGHGTFLKRNITHRQRSPSSMQRDPSRNKFVFSFFAKAEPRPAPVPGEEKDSAQDLKKKSWRWERGDFLHSLSFLFTKF